MQSFASQGELELVSAPKRPYLQACQISTDDFTWFKDSNAYWNFYLLIRFCCRKGFNTVHDYRQNSLADNNILQNTVVKLNVLFVTLLFKGTITSSTSGKGHDWTFVNGEITSKYQTNFSLLEPTFIIEYSSS